MGPLLYQQQRTETTLCESDLYHLCYVQTGFVISILLFYASELSMWKKSHMTHKTSLCDRERILEQRVALPTSPFSL